MCRLLKYKGGIFVLQFMTDCGIMNSAENRNCGVPPLLIRLKAPSLRVFSHEGEALDQYDERVKYHDI